MNVLIAHLNKYPKLKKALIVLVAAWLATWLISVGVQWLLIDMLMQGSPFKIGEENDTVRLLDRIEIFMAVLVSIRFVISIGLIGLVFTLLLKPR